ncbi:hypothetical protein Acy02nite_11530 [Actinoplanes cyaneus]|uniref:Uncharacterized protein n=1 Tax=Actinoplanes cyaneus TaxID=52696 RepID=A0A919IF69_9ACTN|nr:hypothetical protein [Actinoplanes cyaneus]MCW2137220.1 hypothetical protein [Actinoplanes cyaneus]GID63272.1 hypothetical protein Acy02nite_11530 [Actinoplanes cyaneus]
MVDLSELREIHARRARLDAEELALIDRARRDGATWPAIAAALGLASRQAAEQRRHRLARGAESEARPRRSSIDAAYGDKPPLLREAALALHRRIGADRRWDGRFPRAALVRETLAATPDAPPGALYDLVGQALTDLGVPLPATLRAAVDRLRAGFEAASQG